MGYVDGFVLPVPKDKIGDYRKIAELACTVWKEHGALDYKECVAEDMNVHCGMAFPKLVNPKDNETIVFAWITYKSRAHRDEVNEKVMKDPRMDSMQNAVPFDHTRMTYGGFEVLVAA